MAALGPFWIKARLATEQQLPDSDNDAFVI
jgi:hypothetical protein